ncbi:PQQ-binding-like beta-propeller repeat protein [Gynuella sp.]|uniref:outer membrane protein assembly factor BamB family protein n=1 Tax=Gynuella sp. TaxID=2969146 RepID=UPI003D0F727E
MLNDQDKVACWHWGNYSRTSGIPSKKYKYDFQGDYQDKFNHFFHIVAPYKQSIIATAFKSGVFVFDRESGRITRTKKLDRYLSRSGDLRHNGHHLFADPYILDMETLEIAYDPWSEFDKTGIEPGMGHGFITDTHVVRELNVKTHPGIWWVFDLTTWQGEIRETDCCYPHSMFHRPDQIVCKQGDKVQVRNLADMSLVSETEMPGFRKAISTISGIEVVSEKDFYFLHDQTLQQLGYIGIKKPVEGNYFGTYRDLFSPMTVGANLRGDMAAYDWKHEKLLWQKTFKSVDRQYIAGDLVFVCINRNQLVALDKWTGEQIWQADEPYEPMTIHFYDHHVYFMDMGGNLRCYEWEEEYISPNRPINPEEAWICPERMGVK